jgi:hypothetical protein
VLNIFVLLFQIFRQELHKLIDLFKEYGKVQIFQTDKLQYNKNSIENSFIQHRDNINRAFTSESFKECKLYIVNNFIIRNAFPENTILNAIATATSKEIKVFTCKELIDKFTDIK